MPRINKRIIVDEVLTMLFDPSKYHKNMIYNKIMVIMNDKSLYSSDLIEFIQLKAVQSKIFTDKQLATMYHPPQKGRPSNDIFDDDFDFDIQREIF